MSEVKTCTVCGKEKPIEEFTRSGGKYLSRCKQCSREYAAQWREKNRDEYNAYSREYQHKIKDKHAVHVKNWESKNKEKRREIWRNYAKRHPNKMKAKHQRRYETKADQLRGYAREHKKKFPIRNRIIQALRTARAKAAGGKFTQQDIERMYAEQDGRCYYCKCDISAGYHVEHVIPLSRGGSNGPENLVLSCQPCNARKKSKTGEEFLKEINHHLD